MTRETGALKMTKKVERFVIQGKTLERHETWATGPFWYLLSDSGERTSLNVQRRDVLEKQYQARGASVWYEE